MIRKEIESKFRDANRIEYTEDEPIQALIHYEGAAYPFNSNRGGREMNNSRFRVVGSHGAVEVCVLTGNVIEHFPECMSDCDYCHGKGYTMITQFDVDEYSTAYPDIPL